MSSVLQRLLHNLNLHSLLPSHWDSMAVVVGLGWYMTVLSPDVTFHIQQRMGYNCNPTHFVNFNIRTVWESIGWYLNWFVFDKISVSGNLVCFCKFTWRILHHRCTILSILIKSPCSGVTLYFQSVSAASASATAKTFPSHVKTVGAKPLIFGTKNIWVWGIVLDDLSMTLTQGHGCAIH